MTAFELGDKGFFSSVKNKFRNRKTLAILVTVAAIVFILYFASLYGVNSGDFLSRTMVMSTPLLIGTLGEIYAERSGVLNLGIEGMMATGAALGVVGAFAVNNPWGGVLLAILGGAGLSFVFAIVVITFKGMQVPSGLGLFMFGLGLSGVIGSSYVGKDLPYHFSNIKIPVLSKIPILGKFLFSHDILVYIGLALVFVMWFVLFKTRLGLHIRSVGENPAAADTSGVNVFKIRYICVIIGGALAGLAGAYLSLSWTPGWTEGMTVGRGWIVIALTIFALWNPSRALLGAWLFGGVFVVQYQLQGLGIPTRVLGMLPYLITLVALSLVLLFSESLGAPASLLEAYERE